MRFAQNVHVANAGVVGYTPERRPSVAPPDRITICGSWFMLRDVIVRGMCLVAGAALPFVLGAQNAGLPPCKVGMKVPIVGPLNYAGRILDFDAVKGTYKVKSDSDGDVDWVTASQLRYSCVATTTAPITASFYVGDWSLFIGPTPHYKDIDGKGYLVVGPGAHVPPLRINADNTYAWVIDSKTTIRGKWRPMADRELKYGTKGPAIMLLNAESGKDWQVWRQGVNAKNQDVITVERMDLGVSAMGTRIAR